MHLRDLAICSQAVRHSSRRGEKIAGIAALLARCSAEELPIAVAYLAGNLPAGRIGVGYALLREALDGTAGQSGEGLPLCEVERRLRALAAVTGPGSQGRRSELLQRLFAELEPESRRFLVEVVGGELRQGSLEGLMADAVAKAFEVPAKTVRRALMLIGEIGEVAALARSGGRDELEAVELRLFRPLQPMLAQTADSLESLFASLPEVILEHKLDGARIQLHRRGDRVRIYSRRLNEVTEAIPEIVDSAARLRSDDLILEGEVLALAEDGRPRPFQETMRRFGRRLDVEALRHSLPVTAFYFDCLRHDGESLIDRPTDERLAHLEAVLDHPGAAIARCTASDAVAAAAFLAGALDAGHEGIMAKDPGAPYAAGQRGRAWLKIKPAHTLDLVVLAAEWGHGRRRGWLSNLHLGARDPEGGGFVMLGKTFKGLTDDMLAWQTEFLLARQTERRGNVVHVRPELVVEIEFDGVQRSPQYPAGMALRFARVKGHRNDKKPEEADTVATVAAIFSGELGPDLDEL